MKNLLLVAVGGACGASARYGVGIIASRLFGSGFPWGTLIVNGGGCFVMGIVGQMLLNLEAQPAAVSLADGATPQFNFVALRHLVAIGFLGGLTTFSAFGWDTVRELETGRLGSALANIGANVLLGLLAVWAGVSLVRALS